MRFSFMIFPRPSFVFAAALAWAGLSIPQCRAQPFSFSNRSRRYYCEKEASDEKEVEHDEESRMASLENYFQRKRTSSASATFLFQLRLAGQKKFCLFRCSFLRPGQSTSQFSLT